MKLMLAEKSELTRNAWDLREMRETWQSCGLASQYYSWSSYLLWAGLVLRWVTIEGIPSSCLIDQASQTNSTWLAIFPWVGKMSTGDGYGCCWGRNSVNIGPVGRMAGIVTQLVKGTLSVNRHLSSWLELYVGFHQCWL